MRRRQLIGLAGPGLWAAAFSAQAQKLSNATIGLLTTATPDPSILNAIRKGLGERGYVEGRNLTVVARSADGKFDRMPALASELVAAKPSVLLTWGGPVPARAAMAATSTLPIVFAYGGDPVVDGLVQSFNRPGGHVTGATFIGTALTTKRLQLLQQLLPRVAEVALLVNRKSTIAEPQIKDAEAAARVLNVRLRIMNASTAAEIDTAFASMIEAKVDALLISTDPTLGLVFTRQIIDLAARNRIPTIYPTSLETDDGGLMSYGASFYDAIRQAAAYVGRILDGENPANLPVLQPTAFELVINSKAARALGLSVPPSLLAVADQVIE